MTRRLAQPHPALVLFACYDYDSLVLATLFLVSFRYSNLRSLADMATASVWPQASVTNILAERCANYSQA